MAGFDSGTIVTQLYLQTSLLRVDDTQRDARGPRAGEDRITTVCPI